MASSLRTRRRLNSPYPRQRYIRQISVSAAWDSLQLANNEVQRVPSTWFMIGSKCWCQQECGDAGSKGRAREARWSVGNTDGRHGIENKVT